MVLDCPRWHPPPRPTELLVLAAAPQPVGLPKRELCPLSDTAQPSALRLDCSKGSEAHPTQRASTEGRQEAALGSSLSTAAASPLGAAAGDVSGPPAAAAPRDR
eukprot:15447868-Alexandrium_andersonii.AAC.1